jgi:hypothetical protein
MEALDSCQRRPATPNVRKNPMPSLAGVFGKMVESEIYLGLTFLKRSIDPHSFFNVELRSMVRRLLNPLLSNSFFLFGARETGKTHFIRERLQEIPRRNQNCTW